MSELQKIKRYGAGCKPAPAKITTGINQFVVGDLSPT
jgi:hypothetical protein